MMRDPAFWWRKRGFMSCALAPVAALYGLIAKRRMMRDGARLGIPVICVGNFTLGGAGKTPTALLIVQLLKDAGETPFCVSRGYGGSMEGPHRVDPEHDHAALVGDEPLLLARAAPTIVARDRVAGAAAAQAQGASIVILDDGLQNGTLTKDFSLAVVDGRRGIGNGCVFPSGPLRVALDTQLAKCHAVLLIGGDAPGVSARAQARNLLVWHGRLVPDADAVAGLKQREIVAFAGIGDPEKFFASARAAGLTLAATHVFADHHRFTAGEAATLVMEAEHGARMLLTTAKDHARMAGDPALAALAARAHVLPVTLEVDEAEELKAALPRGRA